MTPQTKFYLSFGRHERYGSDTPIEREDMLAAFLTGRQLKMWLPQCTTVYHSPLARAAETARFEALGMEVEHLLCVDALNEDATKFEVNKFINELLYYTDETVQYYHFVTHLPVVEKLGLPFLSAGEVCLLTADNKDEMLAENFKVQVIKKPEISAEIWQKLALTPENLRTLSADEIYQKVQVL
ncbi:MAG: hypothetical protein IKR92_05830 [Alphaproteobacteria bacterium]|nr:hypothetical protein [Alphaproteobacteria bacterium]